MRLFIQYLEICLKPSMFSPSGGRSIPVVSTELCFVTTPFLLKFIIVFFSLKTMRNASFYLDLAVFVSQMCCSIIFSFGQSQTIYLQSIRWKATLMLSRELDLTQCKRLSVRFNTVMRHHEVLTYFAACLYHWQI